ncbi:hypothetical protein [Streptomyces sp. NPDC056821]|uniref:hypothetical protein n=1 Tax=unclassified Streptomyces TaxID=2593676 RepID=UPI0036A60E81
MHPAVGPGVPGPISRATPVPREDTPAARANKGPARRSAQPGCVAELTPLLQGFDHIGDGDS